MFFNKILLGIVPFFIDFIYGIQIRIVEQFLKSQVYSSIMIDNCDIQEELLEEFTELSYKFDVYISHWNTSVMPSVYGSLIVSNNLKVEELSRIFQSSGSQRSLMVNTWLFYSPLTNNEVSEYFKNNQFRMGLNANVFFLCQLNKDYQLIQALGSGTTNVDLLV